jgi:outer membrane protein assembly factor BamD (BamD/ComL family)
MKFVQLAFALMFLVSPILAQEKKDEGPSSEKAQKSYKEAMDYLHRRMVGSALDTFKKADKHDGGRCLACQRQIVKYALGIARLESGGGCR